MSITGVVVTAQLSSLASGSGAQVTGRAGIGIAGSSRSKLFVSAMGAAATGEIGTVELLLDGVVVGSAGIGAAGSSSEEVFVFLVGASAIGQVGTVGLLLHSVFGIGQVGTLGLLLDSIFATGFAGSLGISSSKPFIGVAGSGKTGLLRPSVPIGGVTGAAGSAGFGSIGPDLRAKPLGVKATRGTGVLKKRGMPNISSARALSGAGIFHISYHAIIDDNPSISIIT